jgi:aminocarboxymuconate-semialdehyde decarboxylase
MVTDVHTHVVPADFPAYAGSAGEARWPAMQACEHPAHRTVVIGGKAFRTVSDACWNPARRAEDMAQEGIGRQVLSPMPELLSYWFDAADGLAMAEHMNATISGMVAHDPRRFAGLGMVPLQDVELAARYAATLRAKFGLAGVEVGTNVNGKPIGHPDFAPFFAAAEDAGLAVFVHALHPAGMERVVGPPLTPALVAFPCENAYAVASVITGGVVARYPRLRLGFSHGGGGFALTLPRLAHGWDMLREAAPHLTRSAAEYARSLYYDTLTYDTRTLRFLIETFGVTQLFVGTDYPFAIYDRQAAARLDALGLDTDSLALLRTGNAARFLGEE